MQDKEKIAFKVRLKQWGLDLIGQRVAAGKEAIDQAQQSANAEEKSSAGDKYETGCAMGHLQKDMHSRQLTEQLKELATLHGVNTDLVYRSAQSGAFIRTDLSAFFIAIGLGKQEIDGQTIYFLSPQAPLAGLFKNKGVGDSILFNGRAQVVTDVF